MRSTEGREEVVQRLLVRHIDGGKAQTPPVVIASQEIVVPNAEIKQISRRDALGIVVVILFPRSRYLDIDGSQPRRVTGGERGSKGSGRSQFSVAG